jgi:hypothetical protein
MMLGKQKGTLHSHRSGIPLSAQSAMTAAAATSEVPENELVAMQNTCY